ncbi:MAG: 16S rRNA (adenine(1518)-N(6)/adenine(1519)-N(6))-dimethyltransferase RsmA [Bryobacteraceae bacterium]
MRQKLGQHFLIQGSILERIAAAVCPQREQLVVEIGPGRGALTEKLLKRAERVVAIELDASLVDHLRRKFASEPRLEIIHADAMATDLAQWGRAPIAGNLPYYAATAIIGQTVRLRPTRAVFLIQKEVADRLVAQPRTREYGYLTVATRLFAEARLLFGVKPGAFHPPPKVESAVVLLTRQADPWAVDDAEAFLQFVGRCFQHKRKTLRNNLADTYGKELVDLWPEAGQRAEQITMAGFVEMYARVAAKER